MARTTKPNLILAPPVRELGADLDQAIAEDFAVLARIIEQARANAYQSKTHT